MITVLKRFKNEVVIRNESIPSMLVSGAIAQKDDQEDEDHE